MRAAVYVGDRTIRVEDRDVPEPRPDELVVAVSHCGICGSDLHFVLEGWGRPGSVEGHEWTGTVAAVGDEVEGWRVGDAVVGGPSPRCGSCRYCLAGRPSLCTGRSAIGEGDAPSDGAFADYVRVRAASVLRLPDGLSLRAGALAEPLAVALHGLTRAGDPGPGSRVLVTGAGPIGALSIAALVHRGVTDVTCSEPSRGRQALAERLGARAVSPEELVAPPSPNFCVDDPFDVALECSGHAAAMELALSQLGRAGTLVLVGAGIKPPRFDPNRILLNELVVTGAFTYDGDGFETALAMLASSDFPRDTLLDPTDVGLHGLLGAIELLASGEIAGKVLVAPGVDRGATATTGGVR